MRGKSPALVSKGLWQKKATEVKGEGRTRESLREMTRDRSGGRDGGGCATGHKGTSPLPLLLAPHPCVTSPRCKLGYTCSPEMSQRVRWRLPRICIGALWSLKKTDYSTFYAATKSVYILKRLGTVIAPETRSDTQSKQQYLFFCKIKWSLQHLMVIHTCISGNSPRSYTTPSKQIPLQQSK